MQDLTLYYLFLKCNLMHYYFDKILLFAKSGCYTTALGRNVYDRVPHLETTHDVWLKLCNAYEGSSEIKSLR
jgi:hypothetical protein